MNSLAPLVEFVAAAAESTTPSDGEADASAPDPAGDEPAAAAEEEPVESESATKDLRSGAAVQLEGRVAATPPPGAIIAGFVAIMRRVYLDISLALASEKREEVWSSRLET
jgi:hypothetical protein